MAALFKKLSDGAQKVVDAAQKASSATGHALSELSSGLENKVSDLKEERGGESPGGMAQFCAMQSVRALWPGYQ